MSAKSSFAARWPGRIIFAIVLPLYLLWILLVSHFSVMRTKSVSEGFAALDSRIDLLERFHDDQVFFHALLQKNFVYADSSAEYETQVAEKIRALKRRFPGQLRFIVWDRAGAVNRELTDEKRFQFILRTMHGVMQLIKAAYDKNPDAVPEGIAGVSEKMNLIRGYFGMMLSEKCMFDPLRPGHLGRCIFAGDEEEKRLLWYYPGVNFSLACFVHGDLTKVDAGPKKLIDSVNVRPELPKLAYIKPVTYESYGLPENFSLQSEIKLEARQFESYAVSSRESSQFLINFRQVTEDLIIVAYQTKDNLPDVMAMSLSSFFKIVRWLIVAIFVCYCLSLKMSGFCFSVQQKMIMLFIFSNGLPIFVLMSTGYEFFHEKKKELITQAHQESLRMLREFDLRFPEVSASISTRLNKIIDEKNNLYGGEVWPQKEIDHLKNEVSQIRPQESLLMDKDGGTVFYISNSNLRIETLVTDMMQQALDFFSISENFAGQAKRNSMLEQVSSNDLALHFFLSFLDHFSLLRTGGSERIAYMKFTGDRRNLGIWGLLTVSWERLEFMRAFVERKLSLHAGEMLPRKIAVIDRHNEKIFSDSPIDSPQVSRLMRQTLSRKLLMRENIVIDGESYLFTSILGNEISDGVLVALYPQRLINDQIDRLRASIIFALLFLPGTLFCLVKFFARRLLAPVESLAEGIGHMRSRNFAHRIEGGSNDEFGQLISAFNQTMTGMQELAVGTAVQEGLLPKGSWKGGHVELFARSLFMSKMGGDYYDYFVLPENRLGVFFGDVAGHGIPAAMIMAMAKAVISASSEKFNGPADMLLRVGEVLLHLKKRKWRRMMTAQCIDFNCMTGEFVIASAGHCYPIVVGARGKSARMIETTGFPLGGSGKKCEEFSDKLLPGESLVLYTDGIVEATDASKNCLGYQGFVQLLGRGWDESLQVWWENIMDGYYRWSTVQDDDLTFLILRMGEKSADE